MAEGFYLAADNGDLSPEMQTAIGSIFTLFTGRQLQYRCFDSEAEADEWSGLKMGPAGEDIFCWGLIPSELEELDLSETGRDWARGHLHELIAHLSGGGTLPLETKMKGGATITLISKNGHLLTNHHLVSGIQKFHQFPDKEISTKGLPMPHHRVQTADGQDLGPVRLCYADSSIDLAVLQLETVPQFSPIRTREKRVSRHERIWHWGYPQLSRRPAAQRQFLGYSDAQYHLAYSVGIVLTDPRNSEWFTDADSALGFSGAPVLDDQGCLVGLFWGGGAGGGAAKMLPPSERHRYRRVVDIQKIRKRFPQFFT